MARTPSVAAGLFAATLSLAPLILTAPVRAQAPSSAIPPVKAAKEVKLPKVTQSTLSNGLRLVVLEDHTQPAVWMRLAVPAGTIRDPKGKIGVATATADQLDKGTRNRTETQIADTVDSLGASLGASAGDDFLNISAEGLSAYTETLLELLADVTLNPVFPQQEMDRYKLQAQGALQSALAQPETVAGAALARLVYGAHPYGNFALGSPQSVASLAPADLKTFQETFFAPNGSTLFVVGDISAKQAQTLAAKYFGGWAKRDLPAAPAPPVAATLASGSGKPRITIIDRPASEQTQVRIGALTEGFGTPKRIPALVAASVLGLGQFDSRLTREIRVKRGLTYGVNSGFSRQKEAGDFSITTFTKNASTGEVVKLALEEWNKLRQTPPPAAELADRKTYLNGSFAVAVSTPDGLLNSLTPVVLYGGGVRDLEERKKRIEAVKPEDVQKIFAELAPRATQIVLVGDAKVIQPQVAALGDVTVISQSNLDLTSQTLTAPPVIATESGPAASAADSAAGKLLLAQAIQAHGGDAFANLKSLTFTGKGMLTQGGNEIPLDKVVMQTSPPDKSLLTMTTPFGDVLAGTAGGGKPGWLSIGGQVQEQPTGGLGSDLLYLLGDTIRGNLKVVALASSPEVKSADGKTLKGFSVTDAKGKLTKVYVEAETGVIRRSERSSPMGTAVLFVGGYKDVQGVKLPGTFAVQVNGMPVLSLTFDTINATTAVSPAVFERPKS